MSSRTLTLAAVSGASFAFLNHLAPIDNGVLRAAAAGAGSALIVNYLAKKV